VERFDEAWSVAHERTSILKRATDIIVSLLHDRASIHARRLDYTFIFRKLAEAFGTTLACLARQSEVIADGLSRLAGEIVRGRPAGRLAVGP
jgi:hypothetical protein